MGVFDFFKKNKNEDPSQLHYKKHKTIGGNGVHHFLQWFYVFCNVIVMDPHFYFF